MKSRARLIITVLVVLVAVLLLTRIPGVLKKRSRNRSEAISQALNEQKIKTDNLRKAMRYLLQLTPTNRLQAAKEVQLELNTWIQTVDRSRVNYSAPRMLQDLPQPMLDLVGCRTPVELEFSEWDVDYLYGSRIMNSLANWIVQLPLRDLVVSNVLEKKRNTLDPESALQLEQACKLFDWTMRNVGLDETGASVETLIGDPQFTNDPENPLLDDGIGYGYLPWETLLFSLGDFIERGRVFTALARQRGIDAAWVAAKRSSESDAIWAIAVVIDEELILFEPKMAMPILDPDTGDFATLKEAQTNERILRRLNLPGQFEYALAPGGLESVELLIDVPPTGASARMKMLQASLLSDERMVLYQDLEATSDKLKRIAPSAEVSVWQLPLMSQIQAMSVRSRLRSITDFTRNYMSKHGVWLLDNPISQARMKHLKGEFESTLDEPGALKLYLDARTAESLISDLEYSPELQQQMGVQRLPGEPLERYNMKLQQMIIMLSQSKVDASFLLAQLHFDRGNDREATRFFERGLKSVLEVRRDFEIGKEWLPMAHYGFARIHENARDLPSATEELTFQPNPQEAGNRMRLRYLRRILEDEPPKD